MDMEVYNSAYSAEDLERAIRAVPSIGANGNWYIGDIDTGVKAQGEKGSGIKSAVLNADYTLTLTFDDGTSYTTPSIRGAVGESVTVSSVSESPVDGGSNVVTFSDGKTLIVKNGSKGNPGTTPVKGTDYNTEADKIEIVNRVLSALPTWTGGSY